MNLFEEKPRSRLTPAKHLENTYDFYDSSSRESMSQVREFLNSWLNSFPSEDQAELKARFKKDFYAAFFELFTYQLFYNLGLTAKVHPMQEHSPNKPDFLFQNSEMEFLVESKWAKDKTKEEETLENRENHFFDFINRAKSDDFFIQLSELRFKTVEQPSTNEIIGQIETWLKSLNPDFLRAQINDFGLMSSPKLTIDNERIFLEVTPLPKDKEHRGKQGRIIGVYPSKGFMGGSETSIRKAIDKKASRYGSMSKPFLLAINATSYKGLDGTDVFNTIFGSRPNSDNALLPLEKMNSVTHDSNGPRNTEVSAFFITNVNVHNLHIANYWLVEHPFAKNKLDWGRLNLAHYKVIGNKLVFNEGKSIKDVLKLTEHYNLDENWFE